jgi:Cu+-exporting ATPase
MRDPVCGMTVASDSEHRALHAGRDYRFCSTGCRKKFVTDHPRRARQLPALRHGTRAGHAEHRQRRDPGAGRLPASFLVDAAAVAQRVRARDVRAQMAGFIRDDALLAGTRAVRTRGVLGRLAVFCPLGAVDCESQPEHVDTDRYRSRRSLRLQCLRHPRAGLFPDSFREHGRVGVYFEAASIIVSLTLLGQLLELKARSSTSAALRALLGLAAKTARRLRDDGADEDIPLTHVHVGDRLRVRPGEKVPRGRRGRRRSLDRRRIHADGRADSGGAHLARA